MNQVQNESALFPHGNFLARKWGNRWTKEHVTLVFGNESEQAVFALAPKSIKAMSQVLSQFVAQHEKEHGILWSETAPVIGPFNDNQLFDLAADALPEDTTCFPRSNRYAHQLYLSVRNLPLNGGERSFKMQASTLLQDRFLVGLVCPHIAPDDVAYLMRTLGTPQAFHDAILRDWSAATYLHIGFEQGTTDATFRLYLEFPVDTSYPLYLGYKWNPEDNTQSAVSRYAQPEFLSLSDVLARLDGFYREDQQAVLRIARAMFTQAQNKRLASDPHATMPFVDVHDDDTSRHSFDINLYRCGVLVHELAPLLDELRQHFGLDKGVFSELMTRTGDDIVGHLSGGTDRSGNAFLTLYHARPLQSANPTA